MHVRSLAYEWHWERLLIEYMVTDACYELASAEVGELRRNGNCHAPHERRLLNLAECFDLSRTPEDRKWFSRIVRLRNHLVHRGLWFQWTPSTKVNWEPARKTPYDDVRAAEYLHGFNQRLICVIFGYQNNFVSTSWRAAQVTFDQARR